MDRRAAGTECSHTWRPFLLHNSVVEMRISQLTEPMRKKGRSNSLTVQEISVWNSEAKLVLTENKSSSYGTGAELDFLGWKIGIPYNCEVYQFSSQKKRIQRPSVSLDSSTESDWTQKQSEYAKLCGKTLKSGEGDTDLADITPWTWNVTPSVDVNNIRSRNRSSHA